MTSRDPRHLIKKGAKVAAQANAACAAWAMLLPEAADGLLSEAEQMALEAHLAVCPSCMEELAEAQRGLAWLTVLKEQTPKPPGHLLANILAQTTGMAEAGVMMPPPQPQPAYAHGQPGFGSPKGPETWDSTPQPAPSLTERLQDVWAGMRQPRLAMTGAMAFFSICLTLNLLGVSVSRLDAQTLRGGGLHRTVADTGATIVRSIQGIRLVYRVESRVTEMRAQADNPAAATSH